MNSTQSAVGRVALLSEEVQPWIMMHLSCLESIIQIGQTQILVLHENRMLNYIKVICISVQRENFRT